MKVPPPDQASRGPAPEPSWTAALHAAAARAAGASIHADGASAGARELWAGGRRWSDWLRARGVGAGDRVVCALAPGPGFAMLLVAALRDGLTFVPVPPRADAAALLDRVDARVAVVGPGAPGGPGVAAADSAGAPPREPVTTRPARGPRTPDVRFLLETSGTSGAPRLIALSDANVRAVVDSHLPRLAMDGAVLLSVLPWHHAFGLVLELLPALLAGAALVRDGSGGRDAGAMLRTAAGRPVSHLHAVPHTFRLLTAADGGRAFVARLRSGLVGGAPVDAALAAALSGTRVRVGYGQTEASPGIALGEPGAWRAGTLGAPLGCEVRLDDDGVLAFRGPNAHAGLWADGGVAALPAGRWVRTGDLARAEADGTFTFEGRAGDSFKLDNGRYVAALAVERRACACWPQLTDALLSSPDGRVLQLAASTADDADPFPDPAALAASLAPALGPLAARPLRLVRVARGAWARTPKGELDRRFPAGRAAAAAG